MAFDKKIVRMTNGILFIDGQCTYGIVEEVNNPEVKAKMSDHKVLGMNGTIELSSGLDKMEASFKLNGPSEDVSAMATDVKTPHSFVFRGNAEYYVGDKKVAERPYVASWNGTFKNAKMGDQKQHENTELTYTINVSYAKLTINGVVKFEIDIINNIHKSNGVDLLATYKQNVGLA